MSRPCKQCGYAYNVPGSTVCTQCDAILDVVDDYRDEVSPSALPANDTGKLPGSQEQQPLDKPQTRTPSKAETSIINNQHRDGEQARMPGRITHLDKSDERPPANIFKTLSKILIGILFFVPFSGLFLFFASLAIAFGILGFPSLSQLFNPFHIATAFFELWEVFVLRSIRGTDTLPIFRGTIEEQNGTLYSFQFIGPFKRGQLVTGHHVTLNGVWKGDTLHVIDGRDTTTNSEIKSSYSNPWRIIFYLTISLYMAIAVVALLYGNL